MRGLEATKKKKGGFNTDSSKVVSYEVKRVSFFSDLYENSLEKNNIPG